MAVGSRAIDGVGSLAGTYADLVDATRTAHRLDLRGWIPDPEQLALERLLLADAHLADATVRRELGPVLADERFGEELIETLQAYFDAGENVTAAAGVCTWRRGRWAIGSRRSRRFWAIRSTARTEGDSRPR